MTGVFIGSMLPFLFSSMAIKAVGKAAFNIIEEVRRQFKEKPELINGLIEPDYNKCIEISTKSAIQEMFIPGFLCLICPIIAGLLDNSGLLLGGMLAGSTSTGILLAIFMSNAGGAWDNAKKMIEEKGGKGTEAHKASVVGDTVGDPFKDTSGPSLNILLKLISVVALVIASSL
jgi:K(+)-stimulated pyrophosphate-energized sodium pump